MVDPAMTSLPLLGAVVVVFILVVVVLENRLHTSSSSFGIFLQDAQCKTV